jgi:hypothetical protein
VPKQPRRRRQPLLEIPGARVVPRHAVQLGFWEIEEAAAILMGYDRKFLNRASIEADLLGTDVAAEFLRLIEAIERAVALGDLHQPIRHKDCVSWATGCGLEVPLEIIDLVKSVSQGPLATLSGSAPLSNDLNGPTQLQDPSVVATNVVRSSKLSAQTQKLNSAQRIISGLLRGNYRLVPGQVSEGDMARPITDLKSVGITVDPKTLLRHFTEGSGLAAKKKGDGNGPDSK